MDLDEAGCGPALQIAIQSPWQAARGSSVETELLYDTAVKEPHLGPLDCRPAPPLTRSWRTRRSTPAATSSCRSSSLDCWSRLRKAAGSTGETWVDVGIGEGLAIEAMGAHAGSLVGVEYRHDKLALALERLPSASGVRADAGMLPFTDRSADIVTCLEVLEHLEAPEHAP